MKRGKVIQASLYQELQEKLKAEIERRKEAEKIVNMMLDYEDEIDVVELGLSYRAKYPEGT